MNLQQYFNKISPAIYRLEKNEKNDYYLTYVSMTYELGNTIYGNMVDRKNRIIEKFNHSTVGIAALLYGLKGSGKTTLSKLISNDLVAEGIPVVIIDQDFKDAKFKSFIESMGSVGIIFDEFISVYGTKSQEDLLSFFDGMTKGKRLIMLTTNDVSAIVDQMNNRPGRVYYKMKFGGITKEECANALETVNINDVIKDLLIYIVSSRDDVSWDILNVLIKEAHDYPNVNDFIDGLEDVNVDVVDLNKVVLIPHGDVTITSDEVFYLTDNGMTNSSNLSFTYDVKNGMIGGNRYFSPTTPYEKLQIGMHDKDLVEVTISKVNIYDLFLNNEKMVVKSEGRRRGRWYIL